MIRAWFRYWFTGRVSDDPRPELSSLDRLDGLS